MPIPPKSQEKDTQESPSLQISSASESSHLTDANLQTQPVTVLNASFYAGYLGVLTHAFGAWLLSSASDSVLPNPQFQPEPELENAIDYSIYCISGTADRSFAFKKLSERLLQNKPGENHNWLPNSVSKICLLSFDGRAQGLSIEEFAKQLVSKIIKNKDKNVFFVGSSRGGLVAAIAAFLAKEAGITVHAIFTFGTPFGGSPWALFPLTHLSTSVAQMKCGSEFLSHLKQAIYETEGESEKYVCLAAGDDSLVPMKNACLNENSPDIYMGNHGHLSMLTSSQVLEPFSRYLHQFTEQTIGPIQETESPITMVCRELEAEIIALNYRSHFYSSDAKLKILFDLKIFLAEMEQGERGERYPEAKTIGQFIKSYLNDIEPKSGQSFYKILKQNLTPKFFSRQPPKSLTCLEDIINTYQDAPLPQQRAIENNVAQQTYATTS